MKDGYNLGRLGKMGNRFPKVLRLVEGLIIIQIGRFNVAKRFAG